MRMSIYSTILFFSLSACETSFLEAGSDKQIIIPESLQDFQAMLDNSGVMNSGSATGIALMASDEFTISDAIWSLTTSEYEKSVYTWKNYDREEVVDWNSAYERILYCNTVFEGLEKLGFEDKHKPEWKHINGSAHFFRALSFFDLTQEFCKTYDPSTSSSDLGLPLKKEAAVEILPKRSSLEETYQFIVGEAKAALDQLPDETINKERPTKIAALALLSRIYMYMGDYLKSREYAERVLAVQPELLNYNTLDLNASYTFPQRGIGNIEVIFSYRSTAPTINNTASFNASEKFLAYYGKNDLRREAFFRANPDGRKLFKGSYTGVYTCFTGFSTGELYLNAAEGAVRSADKKKAIDYMNILGRNRIKNYIDLQEEDFPDHEQKLPYNRTLLAYVLKERRKELYRRGLHWGDLKRLNHEGVILDTLKRTVNGQEIILLPNSSQYVWPIPQSEVELSGLEQN